MKLVIVICLIWSAAMGSVQHNYLEYAPYLTDTPLLLGVTDFGNFYHTKSENNYFGGHILGLNGYNTDLSNFQKAPESFNLPSQNFGSITSIAPYFKKIVRYTNTPTKTYEVKEENYDPVPVPILKDLNTFRPTRVLNINSQPTTIGSGSLGVVHLGNGKFALGSGSLGISSNLFKPSQGPFKGVKGGLYEVPAPKLGSPQSDYSAFARHKD